LTQNGSDLTDLLSDEFIQRRGSGYDVAAIEDPILRTLSDGTVAGCNRLFDRLQEAPRPEDWAHEVPSDIEEIRGLLPEAPPLPELDEEGLRDRLQAAWLGRCADCVVGKPADGWDTGCNGATVGSAFGAMHGTGKPPDSWVKPLNDCVRSATPGFDYSGISNLAERMLRLVGADGTVSRGTGA